MAKTHPPYAPEGIVNLYSRDRRYARLGLGFYRRLRDSRHAGDLGPGLKGLGAGGSILVGGDVVAAEMNPDSPDEMAFGQLRAPISAFKSNSYAGSSSRIPTDPTGERRNWQFRQRFRGLRSCRPNPSGESGFMRRAPSSRELFGTQSASWVVRI